MGDMKPKLTAKIADAFNMTQCLVFCRTNVDCNNLESYLNGLGGTKSYGGKMETGKENPYSCVVLAGMREQSERRLNLDAFREGDVRFLVCTDVAARGIDVSSLPFVIQTTLPDDIENYIHRIGRCGRAERMGLAISIVSTEREKVWYHKCASRGKNCVPYPGNTKLTIPFGPGQKLMPRDDSKWIVDEGGCTIWYDEPTLLTQIEKRLGEPMKVMDTYDFSVPGVLESPLAPDQWRKQRAIVASEPPSRRALARKKQESQVIVYGAKKSDTSLITAAKHTTLLAPVVNELSSLEKEIQILYAKAMWGASIGNNPIQQDAAHDNAEDRRVFRRVTESVEAPRTTASATPVQQIPQRTTTGWGAPGDKPKKKARW